jgi:hypothetical protein
LSIAVDEVLRYVKNTPAKLNVLAISKLFPFYTLPDSIIAIVALTNLYQARSQGDRVSKSLKNTEKNNLPRRTLQYIEYFPAWVGSHKAIGYEPLLRVCTTSIADALGKLVLLLLSIKCHKQTF